MCVNRTNTVKHGKKVLPFTPQTILSCKPEGDSRLSELRRHIQSLWEQPSLEEEVKQEAEQELRDSEEKWRTLLQSAESTLEKAEVQYSVSRELEAFRSQARSTESWVRELMQQAGSTGSGTQGSRAQIEDRLSMAQVQQKTGIVISFILTKKP